MAPRKKRRKVKFYKADFKIPESTKKRLNGFCTKNNTTANKVFRRALVEFLDKNHFHFEHYQEIPENQLSIFDLLEEGAKK